jgi:D-alanyl-D-alanine carboxypeptidase
LEKNAVNVKHVARSSALVLAAVLAPAFAARSEDAPLVRCIVAEAQKLDFSGVVEVMQPAGPIFYAHGRLNGPGSPEVGPDTRFNLASAGKMFTAVAVAQLADAGKVGLDSEVGRYVRGLNPETAKVTIRQLLTHSAGVGNYFTPDNLAAVEKARSASDLLPLIASEAPAFPPGSKFEYSNSGFLLLGVLIEKVSGQRYDAYLQDHVFRSAGMSQTGMDPGPATTRAVGMTSMPAPPPGSMPGGPPSMLLRPPAGVMAPKGPLRPAPEAAVFGGPAGGGYSTANDMQRFFAALSSGKLVSETTLKVLSSAQIVAAPASAAGPERRYGLGFGIGAFEGHHWYGHNGGAPGANTELAAFPDDQVSIVVLSDRDPPTGSMLFQKIRQFVFKPGMCGGG